MQIRRIQKSPEESGILLFLIPFHTILASRKNPEESGRIRNLLIFYTFLYKSCRPGESGRVRRSPEEFGISQLLRWFCTSRANQESGRIWNNSKETTVLYFLNIYVFIERDRADHESPKVHGLTSRAIQGYPEASGKI